MIGNKAAQNAGFINNENPVIKFIAGETVSLKLANSFSGDPVIPVSDSVLSSRIANLRIQNPKFIDAGIPFNLPFPANSGSCGLGLGGAAPSTDAGPGGSILAIDNPTGFSTFGSGSSEDPFIISFNNPRNGGDDSTYSLPAIPASLVSDSGIPAFAQFYEGSRGTGTALITITGIAVIDTESNTIKLTTDQGLEIIYSEDGSKSANIQNESLADLVNQIGGINGAFDFLQSGQLTLTIPQELIENELISKFSSSNLGISNLTVDVPADLSGTAMIDGDRVTGTFVGGANISFNVTGVDNTQIIQGTNNLSLSLDISNPGTLDGFSLSNATATMLINGGTADVQSINGKISIDNSTVSIANGINASGVTLINFDIVPSLDELQNGQGPTVEDCVNQCTAQGADPSTCQTACELDPANPQLPNPDDALVQECINQCIAGGGTNEVCAGPCQANPQNPQF